MRTRISVAFDPHSRKQQKNLLIFSGFESAFGIALSTSDIQRMISNQYPHLHTQIHNHEQYFQYAGYIPLLSGIFFLLFPISFTAWCGTLCVGASLLYIIIAIGGVYSLSPVALSILYVIMALTTILSDARAWPFYWKNTVLDVYILAVIKLGFIGWAIYELKTYMEFK